MQENKNTEPQKQRRYAGWQQHIPKTYLEDTSELQESHTELATAFTKEDNIHDIFPGHVVTDACASNNSSELLLPHLFCHQVASVAS